MEYIYTIEVGEYSNSTLMMSHEKKYSEKEFTKLIKKCYSEIKNTADPSKVIGEYEVFQYMKEKFGFKDYEVPIQASFFSESGIAYEVESEAK